MTTQFEKQKTEPPKDAETERQKLFGQTTVYINAGGKATRLESVLPKGPTGVNKALIDFNSQPLIKSHTDLLLKLNFRNILVGAGNHLDIKKYYTGQETERLNIVNTENPEDTGGDLIKAIRGTNNLGKHVLVENVDTFLYIENLTELLSQHEKSGATATIVLTTLKGVPNEGAFFVDKNNKVIFSREAKNEYGLVEPTNWSGLKASSTGVVVFKTGFLQNHNWQPGQKSLSIYRDLLAELVKRGELYAYNNQKNLFFDVGTPQTYHLAKLHEKALSKALEKKYLKPHKP